MKSIYIDVCTLCRPFDNQNSMRIRLETDAFYLILDKTQKGIFELITSPVHYREIIDISDVHEKHHLLSLVNELSVYTEFNSLTARKRAEELVLLKFGLADSAHIAFAEQSADFFLTCDEKLLR
ncbi:MAG: hypothetical protein KJ799_05080 [Bacteroidetes bacterium]|nr:hypothetical protein [Bacteroidota bacterium]